MKAVVLHNPSAGDGTERDDVRRALDDNGLTVLATASSVDPLREQVHRAEVAVVVGGDGTVRDLLIELRNTDMPVVIVPAGTANNIARSLGIPVEDPYAAVRAMRRGRAHPIDFDVPSVRRVGDGHDGSGRDGGGRDGGGRGEPEHFVESVGGGVVAQALRAAEEHEDALGDISPDGNALGRAHLRQLLREIEPSRWEVHVDGVDVSGDMLGIEVMNTPSVGPNVELAPNAQPADGRLAVVLIGDGDREQLAAVLDGEDREGLRKMVSTTASTDVRFRVPDGALVHLDDEFVEPAQGWWHVTTGPHVTVVLGDEQFSYVQRGSAGVQASDAS